MRLTEEERQRILKENEELRPCSKCGQNCGQLTNGYIYFRCDFSHNRFRPRPERKEKVRKYPKERKSRIASIVIALFLLSGIPAHAEVSTYKDVGAMWDLVSQYSPSDEITAAVVGHICYESNCLSNAVGGGYLQPGYDEKATEAIDAGMDDGSSRDGFIKHKIGRFQIWGYGLMQWVNPDRLAALYDFAAENGTSISDADMQVRFIFYDLENNLSKEWEKILEAEDASEAGIRFAHWYGGTSDGLKLSDRAWLANELFKEYGGNND